MDFAIRQLAEKQSFMVFHKAQDSLLLWHPSCSWEIASSLRSSQNPFSTLKSD
jgi:hypothetical protein